MAAPAVHLLLHEFGPDARFEGGLLGALERIESGNAVRLIDALFVGSDATTGELLAIDLRAEGTAGLLLFRLDPEERQRATQHVLAGRAGGVAAETVRELGRALRPGCAVVAVLVEHRWAVALDDAVSRTGGTTLASEFVDAAELGDVAPRLLAATCGRSG